MRVKEGSFNFLKSVFSFFFFLEKPEQAQVFLPQATVLYNQDLRSGRSSQHCFKQLHSPFSCMGSLEEPWKSGLTSMGEEGSWHSAGRPQGPVGPLWVAKQVRVSPWPVSCSEHPRLRVEGELCSVNPLKQRVGAERDG